MKKQRAGRACSLGSIRGHSVLMTSVRINEKTEEGERQGAEKLTGSHRMESKIVRSDHDLLSSGMGCFYFYQSIAVALMMDISTNQ